MKRLTFFLLLFVSVNMVYGQTLFPEVFSCFGGYAQNSTVQLTWTAGEPLYTTVQNNSNILTQGFNQSVYVTTVSTGIKDVPGYSIFVYPNPTSHILNISLQSEKSKLLTLQLLDIQGNSLIIQKTAADLEQLNISQFANGVYLLNICDNKQIIKTFKIQKTQ